METHARRTTSFLILSLAFLLLANHAFAQNWTPVVISVNPANNVMDVPINTTVTGTFSKEMNASSINTKTFRLEQRTTPAEGIEQSIPLAGTVWYNSSTRTAVFAPKYRLRPDQQYGNVFTATITTGVKDREGNNFEHDYVWSFTTGIGRYNTGVTTSQQNETASIVVVPTPQASAPATVASIPVAPVTAPRSPWLSDYALGVYFILFVLGVVLLYLQLRETATTQASRPRSRREPFGQIHPVESVQGVGPVYAKRLANLGITDTQQLWRANTTVVADKLNLDAKTVQNWQQMAELMAVGGIGPQYAELLERSGVHSIKDLAASEPNRLLRRVQSKQESLDVNIQGNTPGKAIVSSWITAANEHQAQLRAKGEA